MQTSSYKENNYCQLREDFLITNYFNDCGFFNGNGRASPFDCAFEYIKCLETYVNGEETRNHIEKIIAIGSNNHISNLR